MGGKGEKEILGVYCWRGLQLCCRLGILRKGLKVGMCLTVDCVLRVLPGIRRECCLFSDSQTVVQLPSHVRLFVTPGTAAHQASLSLTIARSLPKFMPIASVMPSSCLIL